MGSLLRSLILTVMSMSSSARTRAAYDTASSEFDMATSCCGWLDDDVVDDGKFGNELDGISTLVISFVNSRVGHHSLLLPDANETGLRRLLSSALRLHGLHGLH